MIYKVHQPRLDTKHSSSRRSWPALLNALGVLLLLVHCAWMPPGHGFEPLAEPAADFDRLFQRLGDGWTGGDGTLSILLPDGRSVWLFGDTLLGTIAANNTRAADTPFIHNCLVAQDRQQLTTLYRSDGGVPSAFFSPPIGPGWFWPGDGLVTANQLLLFLHYFEPQGSDLWSWRWRGTMIATLSLPDLQWIATDPAPGADHILYGVSILQTEEFTYIYGADDQPFPKHAHVAKALPGRIKDPWRYFSSQGWSADPRATSSILTGVSAQYSVIQRQGFFFLFTMDGREPFSNLLVAYRALSPSGPWQGPVKLYQAPEAKGDIVAYNPFAHTQFSDQNKILISYNLNHISDATSLFRDASIYRPRFVRIRIPAMEQQFDAMAGGPTPKFQGTE